MGRRGRVFLSGMEKPAAARFPIHDLIARRWSPRVFADRPVEPEKLSSLLEAGRWAASSFNEQPWRFLVAPREDREGFERLFSSLVEANQKWAKSAPVLVLTAAKLYFEKSGAANRHALHDVGLATANVMLEAVALGLSVHAMAGFEVEKARQACAVPPGFDPVAMLAVGYPGDPETHPEPLRSREKAPRERRPLGEIAFRSRFGDPLPAAR
jgi:nitroreductase